MTRHPWPRKTREIFSHHCDSTIWNEFRFRDGDIVVATYGKSGTTWTQQVVSQLLFDGIEGLDVMGQAPWLDFRILPRQETLDALEAQTHRRSIKTHLPLDALVYSPEAKYIYVGRDGRDTCWSLYNHHGNMGDELLALLNDQSGPPLRRPDCSVVEYFRRWMEKDGYPLLSFWENVQSWWSFRFLPNLLLVHFADLKADLPGEMRRIAKFLEVPVDESRFPVLVEHCTFEYMKRTASVALPTVERLFTGGANSFIYKGSNGRWREMLGPEECERYEAMAEQELGAECARWLTHGRAGQQVEQRRRAGF